MGDLAGWITIEPSDSRLPRTHCCAGILFSQDSKHPPCLAYVRCKLLFVHSVGVWITFAHSVLWHAFTP